jgi:hypothetical protein
LTPAQTLRDYLAFPMFKPDFARENYGCRCGKMLQLFFGGKHLNLRETRNAALHPRGKRFKEIYCVEEV